MKFYKVTGIEVFVRANTPGEAIETAFAGMDPALGLGVAGTDGIFDYAGTEDDPPHVVEVDPEDYPVVVN